MVMSSFLMNSSPAAYNSTAADPKFPPSEEYSQGNYIPDYYAATQTSASVPQSHHHQSTVAAHYGYHHHLYAPSALQEQSPLGSVPSGALSSYTGHHNHHLNSSAASIHGSLSASSQYYNPCTGSVSHGPNAGHLMGTPHSALNSGSHGTRIPSPSSSLPLPLHRSPSPRGQSMGNLVEPPSPPDCSGSDTDSEANPVIYPWMKKVHVNQGEFFIFFSSLKLSLTLLDDPALYTLVIEAISF